VARGETALDTEDSPLPYCFAKGYRGSAWAPLGCPCSPCSQSPSMGGKIQELKRRRPNPFFRIATRGPHQPSRPPLRVIQSRHATCVKASCWKRIQNPKKQPDASHPEPFPSFLRPRASSSHRAGVVRSGEGRRRSQTFESRRGGAGLFSATGERGVCPRRSGSGGRRFGTRR